MDLSKCTGEECPLKDTCLRYLYEPDSMWQSYFNSPPFETKYFSSSPFKTKYSGEDEIITCKYYIEELEDENV